MARQKNGFDLGIPRPAFRKKRWGNWGPAFFSGPPDRDKNAAVFAATRSEAKERNTTSWGVRGPHRGTPRRSLLTGRELLRQLHSGSSAANHATFADTPRPRLGGGGKGGRGPAGRAREKPHAARPPHPRPPGR